MSPLEIVVYVLGAVVFFALVMTSIALHEIGHLIPGKLFGVKTTQYFVGFGRTLWSRRKGETEYGIKAIPLGGYVRFVGMYPPGKDRPGQVRAARTGIFQSLADQARAAEWETIRPEDEGRLFYQKRGWQKVIIMAAGPTMNILLAFVILLGVTGLYGLPQQTLTISTVSECVIPQARAQQAQQDGTEAKCLASDPKTPAYEMGIRPGDVVLAFNGTTITDWDQMRQLIEANLARPAQVTVQRDGETVKLPAVNTVVTGVSDQVDPSKIVQAGFLGVSPVQELQKGGPIVVVKEMWTMTQQVAQAIVRFPVKVYTTAANLVTGKERDPNGPMSIVGASRVAGEVASTDLLSPGTKLAQLFALLGSVNLFVGLFNFVPLLPLDGGHIVGALYEALKRRLARAFGRSDPGHVDTAMMLPVAYVVGGVIAVSGLVLIIADIIDPIKLFT